MAKVTDVDQKCAEHKDWRRQERVRYLKDARQEILEGIVGYLQALTLDGEHEEIEETRLPGVVALVRAFQHVDHVGGELDTQPQDEEDLRTYIEYDAKREEAS